MERTDQTSKDAELLVFETWTVWRLRVSFDVWRGCIVSSGKVSSTPIGVSAMGLLSLHLIATFSFLNYVLSSRHSSKPDDDEKPDF